MSLGRPHATLLYDSNAHGLPSTLRIFTYFRLNRHPPETY